MMHAIKEMHIDHASGSNGFNGHFFKKCWPIVEPDIKMLTESFSFSSLNIQSINGLLIVLIPMRKSRDNQ